MAPEGSGFSSLASLSQALLTSFSYFPSMTPVPLLYPQVPHNNSLTKTSPFSETLPTPFSSELSEPVPLNISLLRIQKLNSFLYSKD